MTRLHLPLSALALCIIPSSYAGDAPSVSKPKVVPPSFSSAPSQAVTMVTKAAPAAENPGAAAAVAKAEVAGQKRTPTRELAKMLSTQDVGVLVATIRQIGVQDSGSRYVLKEFERLLEHDNPDVRQEVLDAAFSFDVLKPLLPALAKRFNDPVENIREDAADVVADIETRAMLAVLVNGLTNQYPDVRENAEFYLTYWTDKEYTNAAQWAAWWRKNGETFMFE